MAQPPPPLSLSLKRPANQMLPTKTGGNPPTPVAGTMGSPMPLAYSGVQPEATAANQANPKGVGRRKSQSGGKRSCSFKKRKNKGKKTQKRK